jgi:hypothetical protein
MSAFLRLAEVPAGKRMSWQSTVMMKSITDIVKISAGEAGV